MIFTVCVTLTDTQKGDMRLLTSGLVLVLSLFALAFFSQLSAPLAYALALGLALSVWLLLGVLRRVTAVSEGRSPKEKP